MSKYIPPHRRSLQGPIQSRNDVCGGGRGNSSRPWNGALQPFSEKVLFVGDSFIRLFGLVQHKDIIVKGFKGASAKGIGRDGNGNRDTIRRWVQQAQPQRIVLCFGSVDVHLSYYHTKYAKEGGPTIDLAGVATGYVEFAASLRSLYPRTQENLPSIHIVGIYPSPLKEEHVQGSLEKYGAIPREGIILDPVDISRAGRQDRAIAYNRSLEAACRTHGLCFENAFWEVLDPTTNLLKPSFQDVAEQNIHIVWETTILLWLDRWEWLRAYVKPGFMERLQTTLDEYLLTKSWADATHIASKVGVEQAFDRSRIAN